LSIAADSSTYTASSMIIVIASLAPALLAALVSEATALAGLDVW
jgi:hypothetical protein